MNAPFPLRRAAIAALVVTGLASCDNMQHQANLRPFAPAPQFANDSSARLPPAHTVARADPGPNDPVATGQSHGQWLVRFPMALTPGFVRRGEERYAIFCADCHGADGRGRGIVVMRGFPQPPSLHTERARHEPVGAMFAAITEGSGLSYGFADRIGPRDRWAIVAYLRALQKSQHASLAEVPPAERAALLAP